MSGEALTTTQWQKRCDALARRVDHMADLLRLLNYENEKPVGWPSRKAVEHALASSGGTGAATRDEGAGNEAASGQGNAGTPRAATDRSAIQAANPALPSREQAGRARPSEYEQMMESGHRELDAITRGELSNQAGRADSSASDEERARAWLREHYHDVRMGAATPSLANLIAAIRHEAMAQAIAASIRALAGDAPAERRRTDAQ